MEQLTSLVSRLFFFGAFAMLALAAVERLVNFGGNTLFRGAFTGGRLLELATVALVFVIAVLLRQIRDEMRGRAG